MYKIDDLKNTIHCADCLELMKQLPDKSIDLVLTDPPYGMSFQSNHRKEKHEVIANDTELSWLEDFVNEIYRTMKDNTHAYIFCSFHNVDIFKQVLQSKFKVKNLLVWVKNNTGMGDLFGDYAPQHELCFFVVKGHRKLNGRRDSNILKTKKTGNNLHPTEKPVDLFEFLVCKSSEKGDIILDPFLGSGTTAVACKQLGRDFIGIEISEKYCKIAQERLDKCQTTLF